MKNPQNLKRDEDDETNTGTEAAAPVAPAAPEELPPVEFPVSGRIVMNAKGDPQSGFNLLVLDVEAVYALEALKPEWPDMDHTDAQGQSWISITIDPAGKAKLRQAGRQGATKLVVEGIVTIVDVINGKPQGFMQVRGARAANLRDGGRVITRTAREAQAVPAASNNLGFANRRR